MAPGAIIGGFVGGYTMQAIGRKLTLCLTALPYVVGLAVSDLVTMK